MKNKFILVCAVIFYNFSGDVAIAMDNSSNIVQPLLPEAHLADQLGGMAIVQGSPARAAKASPSKKKKSPATKSVKKLGGIGSKYSPGEANKSLLHKATHGRKSTKLTGKLNSGLFNRPKSVNVLDFDFESEEVSPKSIVPLRSPKLTTKEESLRHEAELLHAHEGAIMAQVIKRY